jgi:hypothetical protein
MRLARAIPFLLVAMPALAAQVTDVATAMDEDRPFELDLQATFQHRRDSTRIRRENLQGGTIALVDELQHDRTLDQIDFRVAAGLHRGLELHVIAPFVLRDAQDWNYATVNGTSVAATSTLANNTISISGCGNPANCTTVQPIVVAPGHSERSGFRDPTVGLAWAIIDEGREQRLRPDLYPSGTSAATWVAGLDYTLPLPRQIDDPSAFGSAAAAGNAISTKALRRAHVLAAWTAFSKRFSVADPYVLFRGSYAIPVKGAFDNCGNPAALSEVAPANCASSAWRDETRYQPPFQLGFALGSEFVLDEDVRAERKIALDVRGDVTWFGAGRDYSQVSDMLGKLTYVQGYVNAIGSLGIYGRFARWAQLRVYGTLGIDSPHFLTTESIGKDLNGDGMVQVSGGRGIAAPEQNPTYDFRLDQPGHRLRAEDVLIWGVAGTLTLSF